MKDAMKRKLTFFIEKTTNVSGNNEFSEIYETMHRVASRVAKPVNIYC